MLTIETQQIAMLLAVVGLRGRGMVWVDPTKIFGPLSDCPAIESPLD